MCLCPLKAGAGPPNPSQLNELKDECWICPAYVVSQMPRVGLCMAFLPWLHKETYLRFIRIVQRSRCMDLGAPSWCRNWKVARGLVSLEKETNKKNILHSAGKRHDSVQGFIPLCLCWRGSCVILSLKLIFSQLVTSCGSPFCICRSWCTDPHWHRFTAVLQERGIQTLKSYCGTVLYRTVLQS